MEPAGTIRRVTASEANAGVVYSSAAQAYRDRVMVAQNVLENFRHRPIVGDDALSNAEKDLYAEAIEVLKAHLKGSK